MTFKLTDQQPHGWLRFFLRMPLALYRLRLGWLLGGRFLMLTHTGRKSGQPRQTVLEVVHHDSETGAYFVAAAWREKADWFKNIQANPAVQVTTGRRTFLAVAAVVQVDEAAPIFLVYARRYPLAFRELSRMMLGERLQPNLEDCLRMAQSVPLVAIIPKSLAS